MEWRRAAGLVVASGLALGGCGSRDQPPAYGEFVVAVGQETFVFRATDPDTIRLAVDNFHGRAAVFPAGPLQPGSGGFNAPWSWHFDPDRVRMTEIAIEVCDGTPSYVERHLDSFMGAYCPWSARVIAVR